MALMLISVNAAAEVRVFTLHQRSAEEIVEQVRTLLTSDEKAQAAGSRLVVIAAEESLEAVEKLLLLIDRRPVDLIVQIRFDDCQSGLVSSLSSGRIRTGSTKTARYLGNGCTKTLQHLRIQEGSAAWLEIGTNIPYSAAWSAWQGEINGYSENIGYQELTTGFWINPVQVIGQKVVTHIQPQIYVLKNNRGLNPTEIHDHSFHTKTDLPFGSWVLLSAQINRQDSLGQRILTSRSDGDLNDSAVFIRIDRAEGFYP